jgi:hypothetical protein
VVGPRPVDAMFPDIIDPFPFTRVQALDLGCCIRCGADVNPTGLGDEDRREYGISALCPICWAQITIGWGPDCE